MISTPLSPNGKTPFKAKATPMVTAGIKKHRARIPFTSLPVSLPVFSSLFFKYIQLAENVIHHHDHHLNHQLGRHIIHFPHIVEHQHSKNFNKHGQKPGAHKLGKFYQECFDARCPAFKYKEFIDHISKQNRCGHRHKPCRSNVHSKKSADAGISYQVHQGGAAAEENVAYALVPIKVF